MLKKLVGFDKLQRVESNVRVQDNGFHETIEGLPKLGPAFNELEIIAGEELVIGNNAWMTEIDAFQKLRYIGGYFFLRQNKRLTKIPAFPKLEYVKLNFDINNNGKLGGGITEFGGFPELTTVQGNFKITDNCEEDFSRYHANGGRCVDNTFMFERKHFPKLTCIGRLGGRYDMSPDFQQYLRTIEHGEGNCPQWEE
jgi:hypothetical protein